MKENTKTIPPLSIEALDSNRELAHTIALAFYDTSTDSPTLRTLSETAAQLHTTTEVLNTLLRQVHQRYMSHIQKAIERGDTKDAVLASTSRLYTFLRVYHPDNTNLPADKIQKAELAHKASTYNMSQAPGMQDSSDTLSKDRTNNNARKAPEDLSKEDEYKMISSLNLLLETLGEELGRDLTAESVLLRTHTTKSKFLGTEVSNITFLKTLYKILMRKKYENNPMTYLEVAESLVNNGNPFTSSTPPPYPSVVSSFLRRTISCADALDAHFINHNVGNESYSISPEEKMAVAAILSLPENDAVVFDDMGKILVNPQQLNYHLRRHKFTRQDILEALLYTMHTPTEKRKWYMLPQGLNISEAGRHKILDEPVARHRFHTRLSKILTPAIQKMIEL